MEWGYAGWWRCSACRDFSLQDVDSDEARDMGSGECDWLVAAEVVFWESRQYARDILELMDAEYHLLAYYELFQALPCIRGE